MDIKLRQVTDNIHGTIFLSKLESELISTPYFYRLHDIYQSSTVYMTYPSNRTKRYEHSLGTMELASTMLFSSVSNSSADTKEKLFDELRIIFDEIFDLAINEYEEQEAQYFKKNRDEINELFEEQNMTGDTYSSLEKLICSDIKCAIKNGCFMDSALDHFQFYSMQVDEKSSANDVQNVFLYRCLLQAIRVVALFHDVGHPPYSHIIEDVLEDLYKECSKLESESKWNKDRIEEFKKCMERYQTKDGRKAYSCQTLYSKSSLVDAHLHERVGLSFLQSTINDVIPELISSALKSSNEKSCKRAKIIYYVMVVELAIAILVEKNDFFKSMHKIVDGIVDADRLDYIMRDSLNSGVNWGEIPYKRLINSAKLMHISECNISFDEKNTDTKSLFVFAYPQKVSDDIEDLLLVRYKIFARINFHHRCMKTAASLKAAIKELSLDYLKSKDSCISEDICKLWTSLGMKVGDRRARVILWNDSWLISTLHSALLHLNGNLSKAERRLKENLEEILLNKKRYYSLLKRGSDSRKIVEKVFEYADISELKLQELEEKEVIKYLSDQVNESSDNILAISKCDARDSIQRIQILKELFTTGDLELLFHAQVPMLTNGCEEIIEDVLKELVEDGKIADYFVLQNEGRRKTGLPKHQDILDEIYLYKGNRGIAYGENTVLKQQIDAIVQCVPWLYVYYVPTNGISEVNVIADTIIDKMAQAIGKEIRGRYSELFDKKVATEQGE